MTRAASQGLAALRDRYLRRGRRRTAAEAGCAARRHTARTAAALDLRRAAAREAEGKGVVRRVGGAVPPLCEGSARQPGDTSENLLRLLERRLDNVVDRLGFARTRPMARQVVNHGHVRVRGRRVNIPSYLVRPGETLVLDETAARMPTVAEELADGRRVPDWLAREETTGRVMRLPDRTEADPRLDAETIIGFYTR